MGKGTDEMSESGLSQTENTDAAIWEDPDGLTDEFSAAEQNGETRDAEWKRGPTGKPRRESVPG
jgi:hypothetical protein